MSSPFSSPIQSNYMCGKRSMASLSSLLLSMLKAFLFLQIFLSALFFRSQIISFANLIFLSTHWALIKRLYLSKPVLLPYPWPHGSFSTSLDKTSVFWSHLIVLLSTKEVTVTRFTCFLYDLVIWMNIYIRKQNCSLSFYISGLKE